jgi:hypothetical protein
LAQGGDAKYKRREHEYEEDLAALLGMTVKSLKNRPRSDLPEFVKAGRRRLFKEASVRAHLEARMVGRDALP